MVVLIIVNCQAQDTIYLGSDSVYLTPPPVRDSFDYVYSLYQSSIRFNSNPSYWRGGFPTRYGNTFVADTSTLIYGLAVSVHQIRYVRTWWDPDSEEYDGWENGERDSALILFMLQRGNNNDSTRPIPIGDTTNYIPLGDTLMWYPHGISRIVKTKDGDCLPMYELYFDQPVTVKDTFYVFCRPTYGWEVYPPEIPQDKQRHVCSYIVFNRLVIAEEDTIPYLASVFNDECGYNIQSGYGRLFGSMYPILTPPDTDDVPLCSAPENLRKTGQRMDYPYLAWDSTDGDQREYELQFAPYNSENWIGIHPTENPVTVFSVFNPDIYYRARIRSRCYHGCPVHQTWTWSSWSDTILFYTGTTAPDTTNSIIPVVAETHAPFFTLTPNPTNGRVVVEVNSEKLKDKNGEATITVCDATGREVLKQKASTSTTILDLSKLPAGTYFVTVTIGGQSGTRKLAVK